MMNKADVFAAEAALLLTELDRVVLEFSGDLVFTPLGVTLFNSGDGLIQGDNVDTIIDLLFPDKATSFLQDELQVVFNRLADAVKNYNCGLTIFSDGIRLSHSDTGTRWWGAKRVADQLFIVEGTE